MLDIDKMRSIASNLHAVAAANTFGHAGPQALQTLISQITRVYRIVEPANRAETLTIFIRPALSTMAHAPRCPHHFDISDPDLVVHELNDNCVVEIFPTGRLKVFAPSAFDILLLSDEAIVYQFEAGVERFFIGGSAFDVVNPDQTHASIFARPTHSSLTEALRWFNINKVRSSACFIISDVWNDPKRLFLRAGPEWIMRRSLHQYLRDKFPDAEVRPEQVVDESHPVDIKVTWTDTNKRALIEVKWLGKSLDSTGRVTANYTEQRARDGAKQLADYLDSDKSAAPGVRSRGYLVVIDARRRGLKPNSTSVDAAGGMWYRDREIGYAPDYHKLRDDFAEPIRMFAEPILS